MNEYIALGIIALIFTTLIIIFKNKKTKKVDDKPKSADTGLPTPPKPPKDKDPD